MDIEKNKAPSPPEALPGSQDLPAEAEPEKGESVESPVPKKSIRKKRAANEALEEEDGDIAQSANENPWPEKRTLRSAKATTVESGSVIGLEDASDNAEGTVVASILTKRRKPPKAPTGQKGNWTKEEDNLIIHSKKQGKSWQDITNLVRAAGSSETDRTVTAVRLRYQKVLKDRDVKLISEELGSLKQAEADVLTTKKYQYVAERYKQLSGNELSEGMCRKMLALAEKGGSSATKSGGESFNE